MKRLGLLMVVVLVTGLHLEGAQPTDATQWQVKAVEKYPALGVKGSEFNRRFLELHAERRAHQPRAFDDPKWPMELADEVAAALASSATSTPSPVISTKTTPAPAVVQRPVEPIQSSVVAKAVPDPATASPQRKPVEDTSFSFTPALVGAGIVVAGLATLGFYRVSQCRKSEYERAVAKAQLVAEAREFLSGVKARQGLVPTTTSMILKAGETAFFHAYAALYETRAVRHYESGFVGFRVAKGVHVGGSKGRSVSTQQWSQIDSGSLTITNRRLIFDGGGSDRTIQLSKVIAADSSVDGVEISVEGRQKSMIFAVGNPLVLATIIRICCQAPDPTDLSDIPIDITYND